MPVTTMLRMTPERVLARDQARDHISAYEQLLKTFADYEKAVADLGRYKDHVARAQAEKDAAENNSDISYEELNDKLGAAERVQGVYKEREAGVKLALTRLETAISTAGREYIGMQIEEFGRRREIITGRVIEAMQADTSPGLLGSMCMNELLESSWPLIAIHKLVVPPFYAQADNPGQSVEAARYLLEKFKQLNAMKLEKI